MSKLITREVTRRRFLSVTGQAIGAIVLAACGGSQAAQPAAPTPASSPTSAPAVTQPNVTGDKPAPAGAAAGSPVSLEVDTASTPSEFKYTQETLKAPVGSKIELKLVNKTASKDEVGHNWVLVKSGQEDSVIANAIAAGDDQDWLREGDPGIIAHTALIEGEVSDTITFDAPPAGTYTYLCTFPKHYAGGEKGVLTIG
jgi:azurin